jgi:hypothetical protein
VVNSRKSAVCLIPLASRKVTRTFRRIALPFTVAVFSVYICLLLSRVRLVLRVANPYIRNAVLS